MENDVLNGKLFAAYISGDVPSGRFNYFSGRIISAQGMLTLNTPLLLRVINAAVSQALSAGVPQKIIQSSYAGKPLTEIHTCSTSQTPTPAEAWPSKAELIAANETWWVNGKINIGTPYTSFEWFYNYKVTPTTGFYSDYYDAVNQIIINKYSADKPGFLGMQRVIDPSRTTSAAILTKLATGDGTLDATDMFFFYNALFTGIVSTTSYTDAGRNVMFQPTCAFFGGDGTFFTQVALNTDAPVLSTGAVAGIVVGSVALVAISIFMCVMIQRERSGKPMFMRLIDQDHQTQDAQEKGVFSGSPEEGYAYDGAGSDSAMPPPPGPNGVAMTGVRGIN